MQSALADATVAAAAAAATAAHLRERIRPLSLSSSSATQTHMVHPTILSVFFFKRRENAFSVCLSLSPLFGIHGKHEKVRLFSPSI